MRTNNNKRLALAFKERERKGTRDLASAVGSCPRSAHVESRVKDPFIDTAADSPPKILGAWHLLRRHMLCPACAR